ncbi:DNA mismatch repair protein MutS [Methanofollis formosanus]|uniref:DNA mismatch repair protein MutS n=1 Tax=Methanofollis formosanus TaxID=299308 RepID=A0A8G1A4D0_9EURY|nr:DNA mismatch repair protein MutS [Methanofollis formosanus]QYZ80208.1 DNA mismatch repair protein MutS [Methanofollis formosanus]
MSGKMTPAMQQFYAMKEEHPDCIIFFRMGDFYETFGPDAEVVARELDIVLTSRGKDKDGEKMPLAGVPYHAAETYVSRLVAKGHRVAICEQLEDPKKAKGIVKRGVVRVVTPGTVIDASMIASPGARYLMALSPDGKSGRWGLAFLEVSTGEFFVEAVGEDGDIAPVLSEVERYHPHECITGTPLPDALSTRLSQAGVLLTPYRPETFAPARARSILLEHFRTPSLDGFGCGGDEMKAAVGAAGAALSYATETQYKPLTHITGLSVRAPADRMALDAITLRNLEITETMQGEGKEGTLLHLLDRTATSMGSRTMRKFLVNPLISPAAIDARLDAVAFFHRDAGLRSDLRDALRGCADIERIAGRIAYGNATPRDLVTLRASVETLPTVRALLGGDLPERIADALAGVSDFSAVSALIARAVVDDPPANLKNGGFIRDGYAKELDDLREVSGSGKNWIAEFQQQERERTGIKSLKVKYNRVFGYSIEVTKPNLHLVPPEYERRQTTANGERFITPELKEKEAMITHADERLLGLEAELFADLLTTLAADVPAFQETARAVGLLDVYAALAEVAVRNNYVRPSLDDSVDTEIRDGRHPVVEEMVPGTFVPNDTRLDGAGDQILIITGANMAGKSTYMRAVALITVMAQVGSFVPAAAASVGIVDRVFTRVGASDDLASGRSTFMVEMQELANILNNTTARSLVVLDEIGRGTSTVDGYSIAKAVLEYLHGTGAKGPRTLFATHFHRLIEVEKELERVKNYHFAVKETGSEVVFLRKIVPGATDRSYGIHVARLAGVPRAVTERAGKVLEETEQEARNGGKTGRKHSAQMFLFSNPPQDDPAPAPAPVEESPVLKALRDLDPDAMTPRVALEKLYELRDMARKEGSA